MTIYKVLNVLFFNSFASPNSCGPRPCSSRPYRTDKFPSFPTTTSVHNTPTEITLTLSATCETCAKACLATSSFFYILSSLFLLLHSFLSSLSSLFEHSVPRQKRSCCRRYEIYQMVHILMLLWQHAWFQSPASSKSNITICSCTGHKIQLKMLKR